MYRPKGLVLILSALFLMVFLSGCTVQESDDGEGDGTGDGTGDVGEEATPSPTPTETEAATPTPTEGDEGEGAGTEDDPASGTFTVSMVEFAFEPEEVWVEPGTTVVWENDGQVVHTATAADDSWDTGDVSSGESAENVFDQEGTYDYRCVYHEAQGMVGTINVV